MMMSPSPRRVPLGLQVICCQRLVDCVQSANLPAFHLPANTYNFMERYLKDKKNRFLTLELIYTKLYADSGVKVFDLSGLDMDGSRFLKQIDLGGVVQMDLSNSSLPTASYIAIFRQLKNVEDLHLANIPDEINERQPQCDGISNDCLYEIAANCPKIIELDIPDPADIWLDGIQRAFELEVDGQKAFSKLKIFSLEISTFCGAWGDQELDFFRIILNNCPEIEVLDGLVMRALAEVCHDRKKQGNLEAFKIQHMSSHNEIPSDEHEMSFQDLTLFCPALTHLYINLDLLVKQGLLVKGDLPSSLTDLKISGHTDNSCLKFKYRSHILNILDICGQSLLHLDMMFCNDIQLVCILERCLKLEQLNMSFDKLCYPKFDQGIRSSTPLFRSLRVLDLGFWESDPAFTHDDILTTIKLFPNLVYLKCYQVNLSDKNLLKTLFSENEDKFTNVKRIDFQQVLASPDVVEFLVTNLERYKKLTEVVFQPHRTLMTEDQMCAFRNMEEKIMHYIKQHKLQEIVHVNMKPWSY